MPRVNNVTTVSSEKIWSGTQSSIWKVTLDVAGKQFYAKTYSGQIAQQGWKGNIETYEKPGRNGLETFVRQPQKEGGYSGARSGGKFEKADPYTMYLSYAKDIVVALIAAGKLTDANYQKALGMANEGAEALYKARPDAPQFAQSQEDKELAEAVEEIFDDDDGEAEQIDIGELPNV